MICVEDFHKAYDRHVAVEGLSLAVVAGQILGLVGPNGAGKTTTLRTLAGIIPPSRGKLAVAGHDVQREAVAAKRALGYISDDPQLFPDLTVEQHLAFFASAYAVADAAAKADELLGTFELASHRKTAARDLSRGMRQMLGICCAYLHDPNVVLFDEPLTGLDSHGIRTIKRTIVGRDVAGASVIVSSHLLAIVEDICTDVLVLMNGKQRFLGPLEELKGTFGDAEQDSSLKEIFFRATEPPSPLVVY